MSEPGKACEPCQNGDHIVCTTYQADGSDCHCPTCGWDKDPNLAAERKASR